MSNPTSNFGWQMPTPTDLVTDLPADFEVFGQAVDSSLADLKGGTSGQVLSKNSNTDMDFVWTSPNPGDITGVTAGTGITGGGTSGDVTVSFDRANYGGGQFAAGKNKIINGDFGIWQRGTSFSNPKGIYTADRYQYNYDGTGSIILSRQTFSPGTAPVAGYEGQYFLRVNQTVAGSGTTFSVLQQPIEDVRTFANQTVTVSFWAKADAARTLNIAMVQTFGTGGSGSVGAGYVDVTLTTSWARYTATINVPSIAGKTIGSTDFSANRLFINYPINTTFTVDVWGLQVEAGSVATPFQTASGSLAGELQLCQRYLPAVVGTYGEYLGFAYNTTGGQYFIKLPTTARVAPTGMTISNVSHFNVFNSGFSGGTPTAITFNTASVDTASVNTTTTAGSPTIAAKDPVKLQTVNSSALILFHGCEL